MPFDARFQTPPTRPTDRRPTLETRSVSEGV